MKAQEWKACFEELCSQKGPAFNNRIHRLRADVFQEVVEIVRLGEYVSDHGRRVCLPPEDRKIEGTQFYAEAFSLEEAALPDQETVFNVENRDCLDAAKELLDKGYRPVVLNMANRHNPGGGVLNGDGAQEENLFRRTNLFTSLYRYIDYAPVFGLPRAKEHYPMDRNFGGIYTPEALVFRGNEKEGYPLLDEPYHMSFVTVAGLCCPRVEEGRIIAPQAEGLKNKMRTIFRLALRNGHDAVVLGALGCGAFRNPPAHVAQLFDEVLHEPEFDNHFALIDFAILEDHNSHLSHNREGNFVPFARQFMKRT